jgi:hypothetical protein
MVKEPPSPSTSLLFNQPKSSSTHLFHTQRPDNSTTNTALTAHRRPKPAMTTKFYFLAPSHDIAPDTRLKLGQIFTKLAQPEQRLVEPQTIANERIHPVIDENWSWTSDNNTSRGLSISAAALAGLLPFGPGIGVTASRGLTTEYGAERLETQQLDADPAYLRAYLDASMSANEVKRFLEHHRVSALYMVTGLKIAHSGFIKKTSANSRELRAGVTADANGLDIPISGQAGGHSTTSQGNTESRSFSGSRVIALKIDRIVLTWGFLRSGEHTGETEPELRGAVMGKNRARSPDQDRVSSSTEEKVLRGFEFSGVMVGESEEDFVDTDSGCEIDYGTKACVDDDGKGGCVLVSMY